MYRLSERSKTSSFAAGRDYGSPTSPLRALLLTRCEAGQTPPSFYFLRAILAAIALADLKILVNCEYVACSAPLL